MSRKTIKQKTMEVVYGGLWVIVFCILALLMYLADEEIKELHSRHGATKYTPVTQPDNKPVLFKPVLYPAGDLHKPNCNRVYGNE